jgi:hypothetical protein
MEFMFKVVFCDNRTKNDIGLYTLDCPASKEIFEEEKHVTFSTNIIVALAMTHILLNSYSESNKHDMPKEFIFSHVCICTPTFYNVT